MRSFHTFASEFLGCAVCSLTIGTGIGLLQSICVHRIFTSGEFRELDVVMVREAEIGGVIALFVGLFVYYTFLRGGLTVRIACTVLVGSLSAALVGGYTLNWLSLFVTPFVTIIMSWFLGGDSQTEC